MNKLPVLVSIPKRVSEALNLVNDRVIVARN